MSVSMQNLSSNQLLDAVKQLSAQELEDFVNRVLVFRAKRQTKTLPVSESEIIKKISRRFSPEKFGRMKVLQEKRLTSELAEIEYQELASLTDSLEEFHAQRMKNLVKLSKVRGLSLEETMNQLGIRLPDYV